MSKSYSDSQGIYERNLGRSKSGLRKYFLKVLIKTKQIIKTFPAKKPNWGYYKCRYVSILNTKYAKTHNKIDSKPVCQHLI